MIQLYQAAELSIFSPVDLVLVKIRWVYSEIWCWLPGAEKLVMVKKEAASLSKNFWAVFLRAQRNSFPEITNYVIFFCSWALYCIRIIWVALALKSWRVYGESWGLVLWWKQKSFLKVLSQLVLMAQDEGVMQRSWVLSGLRETMRSHCLSLVSVKYTRILEKPVSYDDYQEQQKQWSGINQNLEWYSEQRWRSDTSPLKECKRSCVDLRYWNKKL